MHSEETAPQSGACCRIIAIGSRGSRRHGKLQTRTRGIDERFYSLDERSQRAILIHMIGYMEAARDMISSGKKVRTNEVSRLFEVIEESINESWNGGMI